MTRSALPPFHDMLGAVPVSEWPTKIDEPVEIFVGGRVTARRPATTPAEPGAPMRLGEAGE